MNSSIATLNWTGKPQAAGSGGVALPRPDVVGLRYRVAYNFPSQGMAHLAQFVSVTVPKSDDVLGKKRYDKLFAITADRYLSPKRHGAFAEGLDDIKR